MKFLSAFVLVLCSFGALAAKLDNVGRRTGQPNFFGAGANAANAQNLFGSINSYLPPVENKECVDQTITNYKTVTLPAQTITRPGPGPSVVYRTEYETAYVTERPTTIVNTVTDYDTRTTTLNQYNTVTSTRVSTYVDTKYVTTTSYSTRISTQVRSVTNTKTATTTRYNTITSTFTRPAITNYITNTVTSPPRTVTSTRVSTNIQYSTIYSTQVSTYTRTSTRVSTVIRPTTIYDVDTTTQYSTQFITRTAPGPATTITKTEQAATVRIPEPYSITVTSTLQITTPCRTQIKQEGYHYPRPANPFNFRG